MPVTTPVVLPTVAMAVLDELHMPPVVVEMRSVVLPAHMVAEPVMAAGSGLTETTAVTVVDDTV